MVLFYVLILFGFDEWYCVLCSWMMLFLFVGVVFLIFVNVELILCCVIFLFGGGESLFVIGGFVFGGVE